MSYKITEEGNIATVHLNGEIDMDVTEKAKEVLNKLISEEPRIKKDPAHFIAVSELADSSVNFIVRAWVDAADYWGVFFDMNEKVYNTFNAEGLNIPYPQMDVHVHNNN